MRSNDAVFVISVAARLAGMHANTLRKYEREQLLSPARTDGNLRLYSSDDMARPNPSPRRSPCQFHCRDASGDSTR